MGKYSYKIFDKPLNEEKKQNTTMAVNTFLQKQYCSQNMVEKQLVHNVLNVE